VNLNLLWVRTAWPNRSTYSPAERRIREFVETPAGVSESVASLSSKLGVSPGLCRRVLEQLAQEGVVRRTDYAGMKPIYSRYPHR
jgi:ribosomal protein S25